MFENPQCVDCHLSSTYPNTICMVGKGDYIKARIAIFTDQPTYMDDVSGKPYNTHEVGELLRHFIQRMGIDLSMVYFDFAIKCYAGRKMPKQKAERLKCVQACSKYRFATLQTMTNLKSIVVMGAVALEAFTGNSEIGKFEGCGWEPREPQIRDLGIQKIWVTYSPFYVAEKPAETPSLYRVLWRAAEEAGLNPQETKVPPYKFDV